MHAAVHLTLRSCRVDNPAAVVHVDNIDDVNAPKFHASPDDDETNSEAFVIVHFERKLVIIGGTSYAGEIKKSIFSILNYMLPMRGVLSMHCAANMACHCSSEISSIPR